MPSVYDFVERYARVSVTALNEHGESFTLETEGLLAVCLQHEQDHLDGKLFVDYLSSLKRQRIKAKMLKQQKQNA